MITTYLEGRPPARILEGGTYPVPGFPGGAVHTYGHDAVLKASPAFHVERVLAVDIETMGLGKAGYYLKCVTVATAHHAIIFDPRDPGQYEALRLLLNHPAVEILVFHNSPFDVTSLWLNGLVTQETILAKIVDTMIYVRRVDTEKKFSKKLIACAERYLGFSGTDATTKRAKTLGVTKSKWFEVADLDRPAYRWDAASDALATFRLMPVVRQANYDRYTTGHPFRLYGVTGQEAWDLVERPQRVNRMFLARSAKGFRWDPEYLDNYRARGLVMRSQAEANLAQYGIRPGVSQDLITWMDGQGLVPAGYPKTTTGAWSGAQDNLKGLHHPLVDEFLAHKTDVKTDDDYLSKVADLADANDRVHPSINISGGAASGRMSITGLPLHQFDKLARGIILEDEPGEGLSSIDWTQQEPVLAANLAGDIDVLERYEDVTLTDKERDMYEIVSAFAGTVRKESKEVILGLMFGQGIVALALKLGLITPAEAVALKNLCDQINPATLKDPKGPQTYWPSEAAVILGISGIARAEEVKRMVGQAMPSTDAFVAKLKKISNRFKSIVTLSGRIVPVPSGWHKGKYGVQAHKGVNYTIQGGAADMLEDTIIRCIDAGLGDALMIPMHDELVVKTGAAHDVAKIMQTPPERLCMIAKRVPIFRTDIAHLGERWGKPE